MPDSKTPTAVEAASTTLKPPFQLVSVAKRPGLLRIYDAKNKAVGNVYHEIISAREFVDALNRGATLAGESAEPVAVRGPCIPVTYCGLATSTYVPLGSDEEHCDLCGHPAQPVASPPDTALAEARAEIERLKEALEPFAEVGEMIYGSFGPALFADGGDAFQSGCEWRVNGERKTLTWGNFRQAYAAIRARSEPKP